MTPSRKRILDYLNTHPGSAASEMGRHLHLTAADIRHHMNVLLEEGAISVVGERPARGRGRPTQLYSLAGQAARNNLDGLAEALLGQLLANSSGDQIRMVLQTLAMRMAGKDPSSPPSLVKGSTQRLIQAVTWLNALGYQARWEAHTAGPRIICSHCPYAAIQPAHPELCQMDAFLMQELTGMPARQTARLEVNREGVKQCIFVLG